MRSHISRCPIADCDWIRYKKIGEPSRLANREVAYHIRHHHLVQQFSLAAFAWRKGWKR